MAKPTALDMFGTHEIFPSGKPIFTQVHLDMLTAAKVSIKTVKTTKYIRFQLTILFF